MAGGGVRETGRRNITREDRREGDGRREGERDGGRGWTAIQRIRGQVGLGWE